MKISVKHFFHDALLKSDSETQLRLKTCALILSGGIVTVAIALFLMMADATTVHQPRILAFSGRLLLVAFFVVSLFILRAGDIKAASWFSIITLYLIALLLLLFDTIPLEIRILEFAVSGIAQILVFQVIIHTRRSLFILFFALIVPLLAVLAVLRISGGHEPARSSAQWTDLSSLLIIVFASLLCYIQNEIAKTSAKRFIDINHTLEALAYYDETTGLSNYQALRRDLEKKIREKSDSGGGVVLIAVETDDFHRIVEAYGYEIGNVVLIELAYRMRTVFDRSGDVYRAVGTTFIVIVDLKPGERPSEIELGTRLAMVFSNGFRVGEGSIGIKYRASMCVYPEDALKPEALIKIAVTTLYQRKRNSSIMRFDQAIYSSVRRRARMEEVFAKALERGELFTVYQPRMDARTGRAVGIEILARWNSPELGTVSPIEFVPVAESSRLIELFTIFTGRNAMSQLREAGIALSDNFRVGINISPNILRANRLEDVLKQIGGDDVLRYLDIELTEGVFIGYEEESIQQIGKVKTSGIKVAIDDFGTGYSNLEYLRRFEIDVIKIDKRFIDKGERGYENDAIVQAMVSIAKALDMTTVVEGVEYLEQAERLRDFGCDEIQGYWFSKPLMISDLSSFLTSTNK